MGQWGATLRVDIETYSETDLTKCGVYRYVEDANFDLLLFGFRFNGEEADCLDAKQHGPGAFNARVLTALHDPATLKLAWNAQFELTCLNEYFRRQGMPLLDPRQWRCTMVRAAMTGLPLKLSEAGKAARVPLEGAKFAYGRQLVKYFCMPCKPTKANGRRTRNLPVHDPEKWKLFIEYCKQDVVAEAAVDDVIMGFPVDEREFARWHDDLAINARGVCVDQPLIDNAIAMNAIVEGRNLARMVELTGVANPKSVDQLKDWLFARDGEVITSLTKKTLPKMIAETSDEAVKEALRLRQETSKSSIKKYQAMDRAVCKDGRVRGLLQFYGGNRTGREAGRLVQVQNLKTNTLEDLDYARELIRAGDVTAIEMMFGSLPEVLSQCIRTAIVPASGNVLVGVDESAIEARVLAWLADEGWRLDVFRGHGMIYEASASAMFNVPMEEFLAYKAQGKKHPLRKKGKTAELACGYQGGPGAMVTMGALEEGLVLSELQPIVDAWRKASPRVSNFNDGLWKRLNDAAFACVSRGRTSDVSIGPRDGSTKVSFQLLTVKGRRALAVWLPSGRPLFYWNPRIRVGGKFNRECVSYEGYDTDGRWSDIDTYGGKLCENITQAIARDVIFSIIDQVKSSLVFHVHDEVINEVPIALATAVREEIERLMGEPIAWAPGLPVKGEGDIMKYYRKGD